MQNCASDLWSQIMYWVVQVLDVAAWPIVVIATLIFLATKSGNALVRRVTSRVTRLSAGSVAVELSPENAQVVKSDIEERFSEYRKAVDAEFDRQNDSHQVPDLQNSAAQYVRETFEITEKVNFRCTVYVPDIVFSEGLYCLLDYFPKGSARGRLFSKRYGIIGRAWREKKSQVASNVETNPEKLVKEWGMTTDEAIAQTKSKSFLCVMLRKADGPVSPCGVLFFDADEGVFSESINANELETAPEIQALAFAVDAVTTELRKRGPLLKLFQH